MSLSQNTTPSVVHISADGILQPIGYSQIARSAIELSRRGFGVSLATLELPEDLANTAQVANVQRSLSDGGVAWRAGRFTVGGGPRQYAENVARLARLAFQASPTSKSVAWLRGFPVGVVGLALRAAYGTPFVYDTRGHWVDHRAERDRWPNLALSVARYLERQFYSKCSGVVSLTELGLDDVREGHFSPSNSQKPAICIPTCVDDREFKLERPSLEAPRWLRERLKDHLVLGFIGSVNADYLVRESIEIFRRVLAHRRDARLLCLTRDQDVMREVVIRVGVPDDTVVYYSARHVEMPAILSLVDWGFLLLQEAFAKRASMPTKLAEFFATGVRPVHIGCNPEVGEWVMRTKTGFSLDEISDQTLEQAATRIAFTKQGSIDELRYARDIAAPHFSLSAGVDRYEALFRTVASPTD